MRDRKNSQAYRERIQGTAKQQQSKLVRSEKKLTHARDGGFPTPTSAGKKTRKDEASLRIGTECLVGPSEFVELVAALLEFLLLGDAEPGLLFVIIDCGPVQTCRGE